MREAFVWGTVAGASLAVGGVVTLRVSLTRRIVGLISPPSGFALAFAISSLQ